MKVGNLLSIMESDIASMLIQIEEFIKKDTELYRNRKLHIGRNAYSKVVPTLKLNLAHFGKLSKTFLMYPDYSWQQTVLSLILKNNHVFADFSYNGVEESYYNSLIELMNGLREDEKDKLKSRILFGSDFMINLLSTDSYNDYLSIYRCQSWLSKAVYRRDRCGFGTKRLCRLLKRSRQ